MILIRSRSQRTVAFIQTPKRSTIVKKSIGKCYHDISEFARIRDGARGAIVRREKDKHAEN
jgi:hypothetical protein